MKIKKFNDFLNESEKIKLPTFLKGKNVISKLNQYHINILEKYLPVDVKKEIAKLIKDNSDIKLVIEMPLSSSRGETATDKLIIYEDTNDDGPLFISKPLPRGIGYIFDYNTSKFVLF